MANSKIRGITIEIGGDTTKLDKALGSVDKKIPASDRSTNPQKVGSDSEPL